MTRQEANRELLSILIYYVEKYPDLRFGQLLSSFYFVKDERPTKDHRTSWQNEFYMESETLLNRVIKRVEDAEQYIKESK